MNDLPNPVDDLSPTEQMDPNINPPSTPSAPSEPEQDNSTPEQDNSTPEQPTEGSKWQATIREKLRTVQTPFGPIRLGGRIVGTFKEGDAFPVEYSEVTVEEIVVESQEGIAGEPLQEPIKVRLSNGKEILKAGAEEAAALIDQSPPSVNTNDPTLPTGPTGGPSLDPPPSGGESTPTPPSESLPVINDQGINWVEITVNNVKYQVGTDYVRTGNNLYATFSGNSARATAQSKGWIMPTKEICIKIGELARKIVMPTQNQYAPNQPNYIGAGGNDRLHTEQILARTGGSFPTDFVVGHKKDVVQGNGTGTCLWGGWKGDGWWQSGGCPHGGNYRDYSQGLRPVRRVRTT
jgi:hypothetical protein